MKPRNLSYLDHIVRSKKDSIVFASYPSSGWNWSFDVLSYALGCHLLGKFDVRYDYSASSLKEGEIKPFNLVYPADARAAHQEPLNKQLSGINIDYCYHTHGYWGESPLWRLDESKIVVIARDLPTALFSHYAKTRTRYNSFEEFLNDKQGLDQIIRYYNSWGELLSKKPESSYHIAKYEDMREAPLETFRALGKFCFDLDISDKHWEEALDYYSFEKQKERDKKYSKDDKKHFHYKGKTNYKEEMSEEIHQKIIKALQARLKHNFGYSY